MECSFELGKATTLIVIAEKAMYGKVFVRLSNHEGDIIVSYMAVADGGDICGENTSVYEGKSLSRILCHILDSEYPEEEDYDSSYSWGFKVGDNDDRLMAEIEQAYWGGQAMHALMSCVENEIGDSEALNTLRELIDS